MDLVTQEWQPPLQDRAARMPSQPLVSIFCYCKNSVATIKRCVDSVLKQSYENIEFVIQDGASTDGTLELLQSYNDPRIKLVSAPDAGPADAFWKAINRCTGNFVGSCLADEELLPHAVERAVAVFADEPHLGAVTFDGFVTNSAGEVVSEFNAGEFNFVDYLFGWYCPLFVGSFFRRSALLQVGLGGDDWTIGCLEFEIWCRLAACHEVKYVAERAAHYGVHAAQLSNTPEAFWEHFENRAVLLQRMFSKDGFFGHNDILLKGCLYNQLYLLYNHVRAYRLTDHAALLASRLQELLDGISVGDRLVYLQYFPPAEANALNRARALRFFHTADRLWVSIGLRIPASLRKRIPRKLKDAIRSLFFTAVLVPVNARVLLPFLVRNRSASRDGAELPRPGISPRLYHEVAQIYYARGQIDQALALWRRAEALNDAKIDGVACQAMLMSPSATNETLLAAQRRWADRHANAKLSVGNTANRTRRKSKRIRVGYFCAFLDSDTIRSQLIQPLKFRNEEQFETYGYSLSVAATDVVAAFDHFRVTGLMSDAAFVGMVRADEIDVFLELSGFSPYNRFTALSSRCAPVQISYLNHTGTSAVPNVDYVLADSVCVRPDEDRFYTEKVWRLPGSFFCFNFDWSPTPNIAPPPHARNGYVTFCCFGSGGKINLPLIELWARILKRVPTSVLLIRNGQLSAPINRQFLAERFASFDIPGDRLRILGGTDRQGILRSYADADITLDTWPYCGGNTIAESIWQGVPVITLKGDRFSSRYGASLVAASGSSELVAENADQYVDVAVDLANDPARLEYYRSNLRRLSLEHGLSDAPRFMKTLESAYLGMLQDTAYLADRT